MTAYRVGDIPANPDVFDVPEEIPVAGYTGVTGVLYGPDDVAVTLTGETFTLGTEAADGDDDDDGVTPEPSVTVVWGTATPFAVAGRYALALTLTGTNVHQSLPRIPVIVEDEVGWLTIASLRDGWRDAPMSDEDCFELLEVSKAAVVAFAPALVADVVTGHTLVPANYRKGQRMQARNVWNAAKVDPASGGFGEDTFVIRPYPLDWQIKQVLRPKPALPWVG